MSNVTTIPQARLLPTAEDFEALRSLGIAHIRKLAGEIWTDHNVHDPGITTLELLAYAINDLANRTAYPMEDLLAEDPTAPLTVNDSFHTAAQILPCNPITINGFRKLMIDVDGVRNAWLGVIREDYCADYCDPTTQEYSKVPIWIDCKNSQLTLVPPAKKRRSGFEPLYLNGLYAVKVLFEDEYYEAATGALKTTLAQPVIEAVRRQLHAHRNLAEDFCPNIQAIGVEEIGLCTDIEIGPTADLEQIHAEILFQVDRYLNPPVRFYAISELLEEGLGPEQIFDGPILNHGFIRDAELEASEIRTQVYASDIYNIIMDIPGVVAIRSLVLSNFVDGAVQNPGEKWCLSLSGADHTVDLCRVPRISLQRSAINYFVGPLPFQPNASKYQSVLRELQARERQPKLGFFASDFAVPAGTYRNLEDFYPITNGFPLVYGVGPAGLPDSATPARKAQARQFKSYLLFFEQIFANYVAQLANVKELFAWQEAFLDTCPAPVPTPTYFTQKVTEIKDVADQYFQEHTNAQSPNSASALDERLIDIVESDDERIDRRNRFLDHLLARFSEEMVEYSLLQANVSGTESLDELICDKARYLKDYPLLSRNRGKGFNLLGQTVCTDQWDTLNVQGLALRAARAIGINNVARRNLATECFDFQFFQQSTSGATPRDFHTYAMRTTVLASGSSAPRVFFGIWHESSYLAEDALEDTAALLGSAANIYRPNATANNFRVEVRDPNRLNTAVLLFTTVAETVVEVDDGTGAVALAAITASDISTGPPSLEEMVDLLALRINTNSDYLAEAYIYYTSLGSSGPQEAQLILTVPSGPISGNPSPNFSANVTVPSTGLVLADFLPNSTSGRLLTYSEPLAEADRDQLAAALPAKFTAHDDEGIHIVENILLRPKTTDITERLLSICVDCQPEAEDATLPDGTLAGPCGRIFTWRTNQSGGFYNFDYIENGAGGPILTGPTNAFTTVSQRNGSMYLVFDQGANLANYRYFMALNGAVEEWRFELWTDFNWKVADSVNRAYSSQEEATDDARALATYFASVASPTVVSTQGEPIPVDPCQFKTDPYSFRIRMVLPGWVDRFNSADFRQFAERKIRQETPAHIYPEICWVSRQQMKDFETSYQKWLEQNTAFLREANCLLPGTNYDARAVLSITNGTNLPAGSIDVSVTRPDPNGGVDLFSYQVSAAVTSGQTSDQIASFLANAINTDPNNQDATPAPILVASASGDEVIITVPAGSKLTGNEFTLAVTFTGITGSRKCDFSGGLDGIPSAALDRLIATLEGLQNYYRVRARLHDCNLGDDDGAIVLNNSRI